jgi:hypothetical protein
MTRVDFARETLAQSRSVAIGIFMRDVAAQRLRQGEVSGVVTRPIITGTLR